MSKRPAKPKPVIGWREMVNLPALGVDRIKAKIDTGARSSALHAWDVQVFKRDDVEMVRFNVHPVQRETTTTITCEAELLDQRWVKSSGGHETLRAVIRTDIHIGEKRWPIELTLVNRDSMGFRMLLGRQALKAGKLLVDPARSYLLSERPVKRAKKTRTRTRTNRS